MKRMKKMGGTKQFMARGLPRACRPACCRANRFDALADG